MFSSFWSLFLFLVIRLCFCCCRSSVVVGPSVALRFSFSSFFGCCVAACFASCFCGGCVWGVLFLLVNSLLLKRVCSSPTGASQHAELPSSLVLCRSVLLLVLRPFLLVRVMVSHAPAHIVLCVCAVHVPAGGCVQKTPYLGQLPARLRRTAFPPHPPSASLRQCHGRCPSSPDSGRSPSTCRG